MELQRRSPQRVWSDLASPGNLFREQVMLREAFRRVQTGSDGLEFVGLIKAS